MAFILEQDVVSNVRGVGFFTGVQYSLEHRVSCSNRLHLMSQAVAVLAAHRTQSSAVHWDVATPDRAQTRTNAQRDALRCQWQIQRRVHTLLHWCDGTRRADSSLGPGCDRASPELLAAQPVPPGDGPARLPEINARQLHSEPGDVAGRYLPQSVGFSGHSAPASAARGTERAGMS